MGSKDGRLKDKDNNPSTPSTGSGEPGSGQDENKTKKRNPIESLSFEVRGGVEPPWPVLQTGD